MKPIGNYNKLPKEFKQPEPLKRGQTVTYRFTEDFRREVITSREGTKQVRYPELIKIPVIDNIRVDYKDEKGIDHTEYHDIGLVRSVDRDNIPTAKSWWVHANLSQGEITLTGGSIEDEERYWYAELCNYNESNPNRDASKKAYFYRVDKVADAKQRNKKVDLELECLLFIRDLTPGEVKKLAAAILHNENEDVDILRDKLNAFAKSDPEKFNRLATSKDVEINAAIQRAYNAQVIKWIPSQSRVAWGNNNSTIATLKLVEGLSWQEQFADWIKTHKNGKETYDTIKKLMDSDTKE
jgi:hypothetical protein